jgi:hypothetical protein
MDLSFSMGVFRTETGIFPHWFSVFSSCLSGSRGEYLGLLVGFDLLPFVRGLRAGIDVCEPKLVR